MLSRTDTADNFSFGDGVIDIPFSVTFCCNFDYDAGSVDFMVAKADMTYESEVAEWWIHADNSEDIYFTLYDSSNDGYLQITASSGIDYGVSRVYTFTYDGNGHSSGMCIYENGVLMTPSYDTSSGTYYAMEKTDIDLTVGSTGESGGGSFLDGRMSWLAIGAIELSASEAYDVASVIRGLVGC